MNTENLTPITWPEVRADDVLLHSNGDRLTVKRVQWEIEFPLLIHTATSRLYGDVWGNLGFSPYRRKPEMPTEPGAYLDKDGDCWLLDRSGNWYDWSLLDEPTFKGGNPQNYAPFTRLVPMPTEEQIAYAICNALHHTGDRECEYDHEATAAVMSLLGGGDDA